MSVRRDYLRGVAGLLSAALIIGVLTLINPSSQSAADFPCRDSEGEEVTIDISSGETGSEIASQLLDKGVTASYGAFFALAVADSRANGIAPGIHRVEKQNCAEEVLTQLLDSKRISNLIAINEGEWMSEIVEKISQLGYSKVEIESAIQQAAKPEGFDHSEGLLFPAQYSFESSTPINQIVQSIISRAVLEMRKAGFFEAHSKFSPQELLVIASLIQAEGDREDYSQISQVIRNRLKLGMPLQFDSTVHYVKKSRGSVFLSTQSTFIESPYNTYRRYGLPPGPINNPGAAAMRAAMKPTQGDWLYFITVSPGDTRFTRSFDQFLEWKSLYKENLRNGKFGGTE